MLKKKLQKTEQDQIGGEAICLNSMRTLQHQHKHAKMTDSDSNVQNEDPADRPIKKTCCSLSKTNSDTSSEFSQLKDIIATSKQRREGHNKEMVGTLKDSTHVYEKISERYLDAILRLTQKN